MHLSAKLILVSVSPNAGTKVLELASRVPCSKAADSRRIEEGVARAIVTVTHSTGSDGTCCLRRDGFDGRLRDAFAQANKRQRDDKLRATTLVSRN
jgi:hypothetical protein